MSGSACKELSLRLQAGVVVKKLKHSCPDSLLGSQFSLLNILNLQPDCLTLFSILRKREREMA